MNPSWAVTKLMLACGLRPAASYRSLEAGDPVGELAETGRVAGPRVADAVAVAAVPLGPLRGEVADLVAALADVPWLGDELQAADHRVLLDQVEERAQPVDLVQAARQCGRQIEAEAVDVHLRGPVAQAVHHQLQHVRITHVQRVAGTGVVHVVLRVVGHEAVVRLVVDAPHAQRRALLVAFGGVVVDHVEDHLDAGGVQRLDHLLELLHLVAVRAARRVVVVRGEVADGVVAPVVVQAAVEQVLLVDEVVHRQQLERGDPEPGEVLDERRIGDARVRAAQVLGHVGVQLRGALHVRLVDHRVGPGRAQPTVALPVEERVGHHALGHVQRAVVLVALRRIGEVVGEHRGVPVDEPVDGPGVRVDEQLARVAAVSDVRVVGAVHPQAVTRPGFDIGEVTVEDRTGTLRELDALLVAVTVEEAHRHRLGDVGEHGDVGAQTIEGGPERCRLSRPNAHAVAPLRRDSVGRGWQIPDRSVTGQLTPHDLVVVVHGEAPVRRDRLDDGHAAAR